MTNKPPQFRSAAVIVRQFDIGDFVILSSFEIRN